MPTSTKRNTLKTALIFFTGICFSCSISEQTGMNYPIQPVPSSQVALKDNFWKPRIDINRHVTVPFGFKMCEETGRIDNFKIAAGLKEGSFSSVFPFDDSDVYKLIEGASYVLEQEYDPSLDMFLDSVVFYIGAAQEDDGYLQTWRIIDPGKPGDDWWGERERWTSLMHGHELYNVGHLYEAAAAHYYATGKKSLLDIALKNADLVAQTFGPDKSIAVPGHEEIEIGLIKLYRITGKEHYLELAKFFVDQRGLKENRELWGEYHQDHMPVRDQRKAVGHAVRAGYLYSAMADLAAYTGDFSYLPALDSIWSDVVHTKMYITGGIGASRNGEAFGAPYELPNAEAYAETCAAIANVFWNQRMFLLSGDGKYYDVLERTLYNGLLSGVSQSGDRFFYPNPLYSDGHTAFNYGRATRQEWFPCACCPSNISRFMPAVPAYIYGVKKDTLYVNLYATNTAEIRTDDLDLEIQQVTDYPWGGKVFLHIEQRKRNDLVLALRIPGWAVNRPVPGDLYVVNNPVGNQPEILVNGQKISPDVNQGYVFIGLNGKKEENIELFLPMEIQKIRAHPEVKENAGQIALQRGPLVYCFEEADNGEIIDRLKITAEDTPEAVESENFEGIQEIRFTSGDLEIRAIPYYLWSNRGENKMTVWFAGE
ncbi:MAG: glycoside hydrolase family 127 protein [Cyclobacteriaceae bacterium]|nr:glycoside hydrolase family 127 protein [Cyclobacteriaceae bacterium]